MITLLPFCVLAFFGVPFLIIAALTIRDERKGA